MCLQNGRKNLSCIMIISIPWLYIYNYSQWYFIHYVWVIPEVVLTEHNYYNWFRRRTDKLDMQTRWSTESPSQLKIMYVPKKDAFGQDHTMRFTKPQTLKFFLHYITYAPSIFVDWHEWNDSSASAHQKVRWSFLFLVFFLSLLKHCHAQKTLVIQIWKCFISTCIAWLDCVCDFGLL